MREEVDNPCVYFLVGEDEARKGLDQIYIGEAESFKARVKDHNKNKGFWNSVFVFVSKDTNLTKSHVKYLE